MIGLRICRQSRKSMMRTNVPVVNAPAGVQAISFIQRDLDSCVWRDAFLVGSSRVSPPLCCPTQLSVVPADLLGHVYLNTTST